MVMCKIQNEILHLVRQDTAAWPMHKQRTDKEKKAYNELLRYELIVKSGQGAHLLTRKGAIAARVGYFTWHILNQLRDILKFAFKLIKFG